MSLLERAREIFDAALDLDLEQRADHVANACAGDAALHRLVLALLLAEVPDDFLTAPVESEPSPPTEVATRVGAYRIERPLSAGGMGVVHRARHVERGDAVALKTVGTLEPRLLSAVRREIEALAQLRHPGIVRLLDHGTHRGAPWYAMELLEGPTLRDVRRPNSEGPPDRVRPIEPEPLDRALRIADGICRALSYLHGEGFVHGDLKPSNVVLRDDGSPVLIDFGLMTRFRRRQPES